MNVTSDPDGNFWLLRSPTTFSESTAYLDQLNNPELLRDFRRKITMYSGARNEELPPWLVDGILEMEDVIKAYYDGAKIKEVWMRHMDRPSGKNFSVGSNFRPRITSSSMSQRTRLEVSIQRWYRLISVSVVVSAMVVMTDLPRF